MAEAHSQPATDWAKVHDLTVRGIDELYNLQMDEAKLTFDEVIRMAPDDPRGYFFKSMIHFWTFTINKDEKEFDKFFALTDRVIVICDKLLDVNEDDVYSTFFLGGAYGYRGIAYQRNGSLLKAAWDGRKGYSYRWASDYSATSWARCRNPIDGFLTFSASAATLKEDSPR
jgi:hypothetical protein